jgi:hypothetical protein
VTGPIIIKKRFVPKVGEGRNLVAALQTMSEALVASGFPPMEVWAPMHGEHGVFVTIERYPDLEAWMVYNATATTYPALVSGVFDGIYPATIAPYDTEILSVIDISGSSTK